MNKYIVIAHTKDYHHKAKQYLFSLHKYAKDFKIRILCIDFTPEQKEDWIEYATCQLTELPSFRRGWPQNRKFYVCLEGGDFLPYFEWNDDDVIVHTDSDMLLQRPFDADEIIALENLQTGEVGASKSGYKLTLREEYWRLKPKAGNIYAKQFFPDGWHEEMYCAGIIVARVDTYKMLCEYYHGKIDVMMHLFDHHAAGQWIFNQAIHTHLQLVDLTSTFHCANWFIDLETTEKDGKLYYNDSMVLFNHTKFQGEWIV